MKSYWTKEVRFVILWIIATAVGAFLALLISQILLYGIERVVWVTTDEFLFGSVLGLILGICQWLALCVRLARSGWWIPLSLMGGILIGFTANQAGNRASSLAAFGTYGIILGVLQWSMLRDRLRSSGIWILASGISWALGSQAMVWIDRIALDVSWPFGELVTVAIMYGVVGAVIGAFTGAALAWMLHGLNETSCK